MVAIQSTAIIRDRGQFTIPDKIRQAIHWVKTDSVISISVLPNNELNIRPFEHAHTDWDDVWRRVKRSQSLRGKRGKLSQFITKDREHH